MSRRLALGVALLVIGLFLGGMIPAGAHVTDKFGHLWKMHIAPKLASEGFVSEPHVVTEEISVSSGSGHYHSATSATIECPEGEKVLSGGYYVGTIDHAFSVSTNAPNLDGTAWKLWLYHESGHDIRAIGYAICA